MERTIELLKGEWLWRRGDDADTIAVVTKGKLAVRDDQRLVGIVYERMVLGETALLSMETREPQRRTVAVHALEDGTSVVIHHPLVVKTAIEEGESELASLILRTLIGQTARNWLLIMAANKDQRFVHGTLEKFSQSLVDVVPRLAEMASWGEFLIAFRMLYSLRNQAQDERNRLVEPGSEPIASVERAEHVMRWLFKGSDFLGDLESYLSAERERATRPSAEK